MALIYPDEWLSMVTIYQYHKCSSWDIEWLIIIE